jgi:hypothetical protein
MRITLHDSIHPSAGHAHPESRPSIGDAARAPWVRAMHQRLERVPRDAGAFAADLDVDVGTLRMRVRRHGTALAAVFGAGGDAPVVAASLLLAGAAAADDDAAVRSLRGRTPPLPFSGADYAALLAQPRPCLGTLYLDARWYDNARVELAATALALASLHGPDGRLTVGDAPVAPPAPARPPVAANGHNGLKFNFTRERLQRVMGMVTKKGNAAVDRMAGVHFRVYPPREFLERPGVLRGRDVFDKLAGTVWCVRWYDGQCDRLDFGDLLGFVDQVVEVGRAFQDLSGDAVPAGRAAPAPENESVWGTRPPRPPAERQPLRVRRTLNARDLVEDANIRRLLAAVTLEPAPLSPPV